MTAKYILTMGMALVLFGRLLKSHQAMSGFSFIMSNVIFANCNASAHKHCLSNIISYKIPVFSFVKLIRNIC